MQVDTCLYRFSNGVRYSVLVIDISRISSGTKSLIAKQIMKRVQLGEPVLFFHTASMDCMETLVIIIIMLE